MNANQLKKKVLTYLTTARAMRCGIVAPHFLSAQSPVYVQTEPPSP